MQKDLHLASDLGDILGQSQPGAVTANEAFMRARAAGPGDEDFCAVCKDHG